MIQQNEIEEGKDEKDEKFSKSPAWRYKVKKVSTSKKKYIGAYNCCKKAPINVFLELPFSVFNNKRKGDK